MYECRICLGDDDPETMIQPCQCRGTIAFVHRRCLDAYIQYYPDGVCRVCHQNMLSPDKRVIVNLLNLHVFTALFYLILTSGASLAGVLSMLMVAIPLAYVYGNATVFVTDALLAALGVFFVYNFVQPDFVLNGTLIAGLIVYGLMRYIPHRYVAIFMFFVVLCLYMLFLAYTAFIFLTSNGNGAVMGLMILAWVYAMRTRPPLRIEED